MKKSRQSTRQNLSPVVDSLFDSVESALESSTDIIYSTSVYTSNGMPSEAQKAYFRLQDALRKYRDIAMRDLGNAE